MADNKELGISVTGDVSDIITQLDSLVSKMESIVDKIVSVMIDVNDEQLATAETNLDEMDNQVLDETIEVEDSALQEAETTTESMDGTVIEETIDVDTTSLQEAESSANALGDALDTMDSSSIDSASESAKELSTNMQEASTAVSGYSGATDQATEATGGLGLAMSGIATIGLGAFFSEAINGAGEFADSWSRVGIAMGEGNLPIDQIRDKWQGAVSDMTEATGRGAGSVRNFMILMGRSGVESGDVIAGSFAVISGAAYLTGNSIDQVEAAFQRVVTTGKLGARQLLALGITEQDVMNATGLSVDQVSEKLATMDSTQRAAYLSMIMNTQKNRDAQEAYKVSWEHTIDVLGRAFDYFSRIVGGLLLPIVAPALELIAGLLSQVAGWIEGLNGPMKIVVSVVAVLVSGFVMLVASMAVLQTAWTALGVSTALATIKQYAHNVAVWLGITADEGATLAKEANIGAAVAHSTALGGNTLAQNTNTGATNTGIIARLRAVAQWVFETTATVANTVAKGLNTIAQWAWNTAQEAGLVGLIRSIASLVIAGAAYLALGAAEAIATAAQWALNIAMDANPIGLIILAIAALIAALVWLYYNNEWVKNGIDWLWASMKALGEWIWNGIGPAVKWLGDQFNGLVSFILAPIDALWKFITGGQQTGDVFKWLGDILKWIGDNFKLLTLFIFPPLGILLNYDAIVKGVGDAFNWLMGVFKPVGDAFNLLSAVITNPIAAFNLVVYYIRWFQIEVANIFGKFIDFIIGIPGMLWTGLNNMLNMFLFTLGYIIGIFMDLPGQISTALGQVPVVIMNFLMYLLTIPSQLMNIGMQFFMQLWNGINIGWLLVQQFFTVTVPTTFNNVLIWIQNIPVQLLNIGSQFFTQFLNGLNIGWLLIQEFFTVTIPKIIGDAINWLQSLPAQLLSIGQGLWDQFMAGLNKAWGIVVEFFTKTVPKRINDFLSWIAGIPGQLLNWGYQIIEQFKQGLIKSWDSIVDFFTKTIPNRINEFINWVASLPKQLYDWGYKLIENWVNGIKNWVGNNWDGFKKWIDEKVGWLLKGMESHSPPTEGPLKEIDKWGENLASTWSGGFVDGMNAQEAVLKDSVGKVGDLLATGFDPANMNLPNNQLEAINSAITNFNQPMTNNVSQEFKLKIELDKLPSNKEEAEVGTALIVDSIKERFRVELGQRGY